MSWTTAPVHANVPRQGQPSHCGMDASSWAKSGNLRRQRSTCGLLTSVRCHMGEALSSAESMTVAKTSPLLHPEISWRQQASQRVDNPAAIPPTKAVTMRQARRPLLGCLVLLRRRRWRSCWPTGSLFQGESWREERVVPHMIVLMMTVMMASSLARAQRSVTT